MNAPPPVRLAAVDAVKAIASQLIVLHHLAFYGPLAGLAGVVLGLAVVSFKLV
jgi:peptidoglycan/LPS O-acetylase OafA/YrhL